MDQHLAASAAAPRSTAHHLAHCALGPRASSPDVYLRRLAAAACKGTNSPFARRIPDTTLAITGDWLRTSTSPGPAPASRPAPAPAILWPAQQKPGGSPVVHPPASGGHLRTTRARAHLRPGHRLLTSDSPLILRRPARVGPTVGGHHPALGCLLTLPQDPKPRPPPGPAVAGPSRLGPSATACLGLLLSPSATRPGIRGCCTGI